MVDGKLLRSLGEVGFEGGGDGAGRYVGVGDVAEGRQYGYDDDDYEEFDDGETLGFGAATVHVARTPQKIISY